MAEIFVNYRFKDGPSAGRLNDQLEQEFDTFIDVKMESGDSISHEIRHALRDTRLFLAVIGREWMLGKNRKRLEGDDDWIRRELLAVKDRDDVRIVPVLVADDIKMPTAAQLPPALLWFAEQRAERLSYTSWQSDVEKFLGDVRGWLGAPRVTTRRNKPPADVPYLCNRDEQEYDFSSLTADISRSRSLVCILHGHKWEAHSKFMSRLQQLRILDRMLEAGKMGVGQEFLKWNSELARSRQFGEMLRYGIRINVLKNPKASDADICTLLRNPASPIVLTLQVTGTDIEVGGPATLRDLIAAWRELLISLGCVPASPIILWINVAYDDPSQVASAIEGLPQLTALGPIVEGHIQTWLDRPEVDVHTSGRRTQILSLAQDSRLYIKPGRLHMQSFADAVTTLLQG